MSSYYMQHMLLQYGRQLTTARRLARHREAMRLAGVFTPDPAPEEKRRLMVRRVTSEIVENLFLTGSDNPVVTQVKERLNEALGEEILFRFPPPGNWICSCTGEASTARRNLIWKKGEGLWVCFGISPRRRSTRPCCEKD